MKHSGKLKSWNASKGFGFVEPKYAGKDIFVHITDFADRTHQPEAGQIVNFTLSTDAKGRACGKRIEREGDKAAAKKSHFFADLSVALAILFTLAVSFSVLVLKFPRVILWFYLAINVLTFALYYFDKRAATLDKWRTQESTLHLFALLGGWPGAAFAQQIFRHKSKKFEFRFVYWLTIMINIFGFYWLHTDAGRPRLIELSQLLAIL